MHCLFHFLSSCALVCLGVHAAAATFQLTNIYDASNWLDSMYFATYPDPTHGWVQFLSAADAQSAGLLRLDQTTKQVYMGVDYTTVNPANGRKSIRTQTNADFTTGLFILDLAHAPVQACGSWPAYWSTGPNWPTAGEIDVLEGVNLQTADYITLHTSATCVINATGGAASTTLVGANCNDGGASNGCSQHSTDPTTYGSGFNAAGGGVFVTDWRTDYIAIYHFARANIPADIATGAPMPSSWGAPLAKFSSNADSCNIPAHFYAHNVIFDITFCGDWAGAVWGGSCGALAATCNAYVSANPTAFQEVYWLINSLRIYANDNTPDAVVPVVVSSDIHIIPPSSTAPSSPSSSSTDIYREPLPSSSTASASSLLLSSSLHMPSFSSSSSTGTSESSYSSSSSSSSSTSFGNQTQPFFSATLGSAAETFEPLMAEQITLKFDFAFDRVDNVAWYLTLAKRIGAVLQVNTSRILVTPAKIVNAHIRAAGAKVVVNVLLLPASAVDDTQAPSAVALCNYFLALYANGSSALSVSLVELGADRSFKPSVASIAQCLDSSYTLPCFEQSSLAAAPSGLSRHMVLVVSCVVSASTLVVALGAYLLYRRSKMRRTVSFASVVTKVSTATTRSESYTRGQLAPVVIPSGSETGEFLFASPGGPSPSPSLSPLAFSQPAAITHRAQ